MKHNTDPQNPVSGRAQGQTEQITHPQVLPSLLSPGRLLRIARHLILLGKKAIARQHQSQHLGAMKYDNSAVRKKVFYYLMAFSSNALLAGISYRVLRFLLEHPHELYITFCLLVGLMASMTMLMWADMKQDEKEKELLASVLPDVKVDIQMPKKAASRWPAR